jgi:hypothetical protein
MAEPSGKGRAAAVAFLRLHQSTISIAPKYNIIAHKYNRTFFEVRQWPLAMVLSDMKNCGKIPRCIVWS